MSAGVHHTGPREITVEDQAGHVARFTVCGDGVEIAADDGHAIITLVAALQLVQQLDDFTTREFCRPSKRWAPPPQPPRRAIA